MKLPSTLQSEEKMVGMATPAAAAEEEVTQRSRCQTPEGSVSPPHFPGGEENPPPLEGNGFSSGGGGDGCDGSGGGDGEEKIGWKGALHELSKKRLPPSKRYRYDHPLLVEQGL